MLKSLFNKGASLRSSTLLKDTPAQVFSCEFKEILKTTFYCKNIVALINIF